MNLLKDIFTIAALMLVSGFWSLKTTPSGISLLSERPEAEGR